eukprot:214694-Ditylum_brightwellii.AAC.1
MLTSHNNCGNLIQPSRINPQLSTKAQLNGAFDFNAMPLAPLSTMVLVHKKPIQWKSYEYNGVEGWYVGQVPHHYRYYKVHTTKIGHDRISDMVKFFPKHVRMPTTSLVDGATHDEIDLIEVLRVQHQQHHLPPSGKTN